MRVRGENKLFTEQQRKQLESNPNVQHVTDRSITYMPSFKLAALKAYQEGKTPMEIFLNAGFDLTAIGNDKPRKSLKRWREQYQELGEAGLLENRRGKNSAGRPQGGELSVEQKLERAEARIKLLEAENDLLKKLEALERQKQL